MKCITCEKVLGPACGEESFTPNSTVDGGGTVCFDFAYGSTQHDPTTVYGVCCDECLTALFKKEVLKCFERTRPTQSEWKEVPVGTQTDRIRRVSHG